MCAKEAAVSTTLECPGDDKTHVALAEAASAQVPHGPAIDDTEL